MIVKSANVDKAPYAGRDHLTAPTSKEPHYSNNSSLRDHRLSSRDSRIIDVRRLTSGYARLDIFFHADFFTGGRPETRFRRVRRLCHFIGGLVACERIFDRGMNHTEVSRRPARHVVLRRVPVAAASRPWHSGDCGIEC